MIESFENVGIWWLPENSGNKLSGILKFDPINGIELELIGHFGEERPSDRQEYDIILGVISGKKVTLYKSAEHSNSFSAPGFDKYNFTANTLFLGHHFKKVEDIKFKNLSIRFTNLYDWIGKTGYEINANFDSESIIREYSVDLKSFNNIELDLEEFRISIKHGIKVSENHSKINLEEYSVVEIIPNETKTLDDLRSNISYHIQNFLSLGIGSAISPVSISGECEDCKREYPDGKIVDISVEIYYAVNNPILVEKKVYPEKMFFTFSDVAEHLEEALKNWFAKTDDLKPVYNLYFGTLNNSSMYIEQSFLNLIQALESYHRRRYDGKYLPSDEYKTVRKVIIDSIPDSITEAHKESLSSKIHFGNELSLKSRLKAIFEDFGDIFSPLITDYDEFIKDVKNTRNYYTHYSADLERKAKTGEDLFVLTEKLKFVIEICFLKELGLPSDIIKAISSKDSRYNYLTKLEDEE
jgi:hypothetical protein